MFVGSGISVPAPSRLPSAYAAASVFLTTTAEGLVPSDVMKELLDRRRILPEFVYGLAERHFGPGVYRVWESLERWRRSPASLGPNAAHLVTVHLAARSHTPVLTPNFDTYLESAAERLGLEPQVTVAVPGRTFEPRTVRDGQVAIWKLHGTATDHTTVFSSVRTLTMPVRGLRAHVRGAIPATARLVLAGYSGRDLDLFPVLASRRSDTAPIWVDLGFDPEHRANLLQPSPHQVAAPFDEVSRMYAGLCDDPHLRAMVSQADTLARSPAHAAAAAAMATAIADDFRAGATDLADEGSRRLLLGELLINGGMSEESVRVLTPAVCTGAFRSEQVRLLAKASWELGRFRTSEALAADRLGEGPAAAQGDPLRFAVSAARMRALVPPAGLPGVRQPSWNQVVVEAMRAARDFLRSAPRALRPAAVPEPTRTPLVESWVEHGIRLVAALQSFVLRAATRPPPVEAWFFARLWLGLRRYAVRVGYAEGIGNTSRYLSRLGIDDPDGVRDAHDFLSHLLGVAIAHRDAAARAIRDGDLGRARRELELGLGVARLHDDPVLLLTFLPLASSLGEDVALDRGRVARIEAPWATGVLAWLDAHPTGDQT